MLVHSAPPLLLVEDDSEIRVMMAIALECDGYRVLTASNGLEALALAQEHKPSLILLDLMMPVMAGEEFRRRQLAIPSIQSIPVLVVSARHDALATAQRLDAVGCMGKPIDFEALTSIVRTTLGVS